MGRAITAGPPNDIYVVSDLHLGEGITESTGRYSRLETFFYDDEFARFVARIGEASQARDVAATLILNGDIFDFLAVVRVPDSETAHALEVPMSRSERKFGLGGTESQAAWKLGVILAGHPTFLRALARHLLARPENRLVLIRGNHDAELFFPRVQEVFLAALRDAAQAVAPDPAAVVGLDAQVEIRQWFHFEPGRVYVEHGNQYEASNAFRYVLNPVVPNEYHASRQVMLDYPMGSIFVRYLYNKMKLLDPFATLFVTIEQYFRITVHHNLVDLLRTGSLHFPFFLRAIRDARLFELQGMAPVRAEHERRMEELGAETGLADKLPALERLMSRPIGTTKYRLLTEMLRPVLRTATTYVVIALLSVLGWFLMFSVIQHKPWIAEGVFAKASVLAILAVVSVVGLFLLFTFMNRALHNTPDPNIARCADRAEHIAALLDVPNVTMGHTHTADLRPLRGGPARYANSGTWIPHPGPWDIVKVRARQFTFVRLQGTQMDLLRWNDVHGTFEPVTLIEEYRPTALERLFVDPNDGGATTPEDP